MSKVQIDRPRSGKALEEWYNARREQMRTDRFNKTIQKKGK